MHQCYRIAAKNPATISPLKLRPVGQSSVASMLPHSGPIRFHRLKVAKQSPAKFDPFIVCVRSICALFRFQNRLTKKCCFCCTPPVQRATLLVVAPTPTLHKTIEPRCDNCIVANDLVALNVKGKGNGFQMLRVSGKSFSMQDFFLSRTRINRVLRDKIGI